MLLRNDPKCTRTQVNAPKHEFRVNGVDWVRWLRKIATWLRGTNFCINCTSLVCFATSFMQLRNNPKCTKYYETDRNISLWSNGVDWVRSLQKIPTWLHGTNFCINCTSSVCFVTSFMQLRNNPKCTKYYETDRNISLWSNGVDWVRSLRKILMWLRGTNFCINCISSPPFCTEFHAVMKWTQMHPNTMKQTKTWV
jgi:hypothetical protein